MSNGLGQAGIIRGRHDDVGGHNSAAPKAAPGPFAGGHNISDFFGKNSQWCGSRSSRPVPSEVDGWAVEPSTLNGCERLDRI